MKDEKISKLNQDLINLMMERFNITYDDIISHLDENKRWLIDGKDWFSYYQFSKEEAEDFRKKAVDLIKKTLRCSKAAAQREFSWWNLSIGLSVKPDNETPDKQ